MISFLYKVSVKFIYYLLDKCNGPIPIRGSSKYSTIGGCTAESLDSLGLPDEVRQSIAKLGNLGIAGGTWKSYKAGQDMLYKCEKETRRPLNLPLSEQDILFFIDWLHRIRKLSIGTIRCYLAGLRQLHISKGMEPPTFRTGLVKLVLKGIGNKEGIEKRDKKAGSRQPITLNILLLLKALIRKLDMPHIDKALVWTICTLAFAGAFRIHELLSKTESVFDPTHTLLTEDITKTSDVKGTVTLHIRLKCPKEARNNADTIVDIFTSESKTCPVAAYTKWHSASVHKQKSPIFTWKSGTPLTGKKFNNLIKSMLSPYIDKSKGKFVSHSFRIGLASMLGTLGYEDEDIQAAGRWSSRAFQTYLKLTRTKRASMGKTISSLASAHK